MRKYAVKMPGGHTITTETKGDVLSILAGLLGSDEARSEDGCEVKLFSMSEKMAEWLALRAGDRKRYVSFRHFRYGAAKTDFHYECENKHAKYVSRWGARHPDNKWGYDSFEPWMKKRGWWAQYNEIPQDAILKVPKEPEARFDLEPDAIEFGEPSQIDALEE